MLEKVASGLQSFFRRAFLYSPEPFPSRKIPLIIAHTAEFCRARLDRINLLAGIA